MYKDIVMFGNVCEWQYDCITNRAGEVKIVKREYSLQRRATVTPGTPARKPGWMQLHSLPPWVTTVSEQREAQL